MRFEETSLQGVLLITPTIHYDNQCASMETFNRREMSAAGIPSHWAQDNFSFSKKNVLRGIHYQIVQPQGKLVQVTHGAVFDVAVDLRRSSAHFGKYVAMELNDQNGSMLWIPPGFGHAFLVLSETAGVAYKATDYYYPAGERTIVWKDPTLGIQWPIEGQPIVSSKDAAGTWFQNAEIYEEPIEWN